jgi:adenylate cyclase
LPDRSYSNSFDALSRLPKLHVVARTSAFAYKGKNADVRKIGEQLNVDAVLEGSVRKNGYQLRNYGQLNRISDGFHY